MIFLISAKYFRLADEPEGISGSHIKQGKVSFMSRKATMSYRYPNKKEKKVHTIFRLIFVNHERVNRSRGSWRILVKSACGNNEGEKRNVHLMRLEMIKVKRCTEKISVILFHPKKEWNLRKNWRRNQFLPATGSRI